MTDINQGASKMAEEWDGNSIEMPFNQGVNKIPVLDKEKLDLPTTIDSQALREIDQEYLCWGDTVHYQERPIIVTGCKGGLVFDDEGKSYIDTGMWHSSCNFGYRNPEIESEVTKQLHTLPQANGDFLHREKLLIAKQVVDAMYERTGVKGRVSFNVGGALVVEDALKIIRKNTRKNKVAVMMGGYHGRSLGTLNLSSSHRYRQYFNEFSERAVMLPFANCAQCFYEKERETCDLYCERMIRKAFSNEFYGIASETSSEVGAIVVEPCQGRGYTIPPRDFFKGFISELRQKHGLLVFDDEIQVGMYRTGKLFAFEHFGFVPDIITLSKSFTNGLSPVSLVWAREDLVAPDFFTPGHAHSNFANHPLGTAAALATWRYMLAQDYERSVPAKGLYFLTKLKELQARHSCVYSVDGLGLILNMVFADEKGTPYKGSAKLAASIAQDNDFIWKDQSWRMILQTGGYDLNVLKFAPYLDISYEEIDCTIGVLDQVLQKLDILLCPTAETAGAI
ncbi:MAG: aspartate aminotransferase family protein [Moorea sp. SIO3G5]|nr:aspartate aminotransferase family protein [Moorena sp. SIO3G5]